MEVKGNEMPIKDYEMQIIKSIENNPLTIITGHTGCGKSTQVPQYILKNLASKKDHDKIVCCIPTRISAFSLAKYVSKCMGTTLGEEVGYVIGGESLTNANKKQTMIEYQTVGVLKEFLLKNRILKRSYDTQTLYIIVDEIHERNVDQDTTLFLLKRYLNSMRGDIYKLKTIRVVLMSATIHPKEFIKYFDSFKNIPCIHVPSRLFKVTELYLDTVCKWHNNETFFRPLLDYFNEIEKQKEGKKNIGIKENAIDRKNFRIIKEMYHIAAFVLEVIHNREDTHKSVLVFLPGIAEIINFERILLERVSEDEIAVYIAHSCVGSEEQRKIFDTTHESGRRKVILSTNIAESSITLPSVSFVIDFCFYKEANMNYHSGSEELRLNWASKENLNQRKGRAGRVANGLVCRLIPKNFLDLLRVSIVPEIRRISLSHLVMKIIRMEIGFPLSILSRFVSPPPEESIFLSFNELKEMNAITDKFKITTFGLFIEPLPLSLHASHLVFYGYLFRLLHETIITASLIDLGGIFYDSFSEPIKAIKARYKSANGSQSDQIASYFAYREYLIYKKKNPSMNRGKYCFDKGLFLRKLNEMDIKLMMIYRKMGLDSPLDERFNPECLIVKGEKLEILRFLLFCSFKKNIVKKYKAKKTIGIPTYFNKKRSVSIQKISNTVKLAKVYDFVQNYKSGIGWIKNYEVDSRRDDIVHVEFSAEENEVVSPVYIISKFSKRDFDKIRSHKDDRIKNIPYKRAFGEVEMRMLPLFYSQKVQVSRFSVINNFTTTTEYYGFKCYDMAFTATHKCSGKYFFVDNLTLNVAHKNPNLCDIIFLVFSKHVQRAKDVGKNRNYMEVVHNNIPYFFQPYLNEKIVKYVNRLRHFVMEFNLGKKPNEMAFDDLNVLIEYYNEHVKICRKNGVEQHDGFEKQVSELTVVKEKWKKDSKTILIYMNLVCEFGGFKDKEVKFAIYSLFKEFVDINSSFLYTLVRKIEDDASISFWLDEYNNLKSFIILKNSPYPLIKCKKIMNTPAKFRKLKTNILATPINKISKIYPFVNIDIVENIIVFKRRDFEYDKDYSEVSSLVLKRRNQKAMLKERLEREYFQKQNSHQSALEKYRSRFNLEYLSNGFGRGEYGSTYYERNKSYFQKMNGKRHLNYSNGNKGSKRPKNLKKKSYGSDDEENKTIDSDGYEISYN